MDTATNVRRYGAPPFAVVLVHGGPGAGGEMAPVARALAPSFGVLEALQTAGSLEGQVSELAHALSREADGACAVVGHSWGAWLGFILAARRGDLVRKLVLVGAGPFSEAYVPELRERRRERLSEDENAEFDSLLKTLADPRASGKDAALRRLGGLAERSDSVDPLPWDTESEDRVHQPQGGEVFSAVWEEAADLRRRGDLLALGRSIACPVVAIHGESDPHPPAGVRDTLGEAVRDFRYIGLHDCGHTPWLERRARDNFYQVLTEELRAG